MSPLSDISSDAYSDLNTPLGVSSLPNLSSGLFPVERMTRFASYPNIYSTVPAGNFQGRLVRVSSLSDLTSIATIFKC